MMKAPYLKVEKPNKTFRGRKIKCLRENTFSQLGKTSAV